MRCFRRQNELEANRFLFTGREWISQLGLYDYRNRVYSAEFGRWLQTDPIGFEAEDVNLYRYVGNNPINLWDPFGLAPVITDIAGNATIDKADGQSRPAELGDTVGPDESVETGKNSRVEFVDDERLDGDDGKPTCDNIDELSESGDSEPFTPEGDVMRMGSESIFGERSGPGMPQGGSAPGSQLITVGSSG